MERYPHLAAAREHVDGAVVVGLEEGAVGRRRLGELVDLLAQRRDVLACLAQGVGEFLVLRHRLGQLALGLEELLLKSSDALRGLLQAAAESNDLLLQQLRLLLQLGYLTFVGSQPSLVLGVGHDHLLSWPTVHRVASGARDAEAAERTSRS